MGSSSATGRQIRKAVLAAQAAAKADMLLSLATVSFHKKSVGRGRGSMTIQLTVEASASMTSGLTQARDIGG